MVLALEWGIKASFLEYVSDLPDGTIETGGGAWRSGDNIVFPLSSRDGADEAEFSGWVKFEGHGGTLSVLLREPEIRFASEYVELLAKHTWRPELAPIIVAQGTTQHHSGLAAGKSFALALTVFGARVFGGAYPWGTALSPALLVSTEPPIHDEQHELHPHNANIE
jgi:hypothetical protein